MPDTRSDTDTVDSDPAIAGRQKVKARRRRGVAAIVLVLASLAAFFAPLPRYVLAQAYTAADLVFNQELVYLFFTWDIKYSTLVFYWVGHVPSESELQRRRAIFRSINDLYSSPSHASDTNRPLAVAAGTYTFASATPTLPFVGNPQVVVDPLTPDGTDISGIAFARRADCSLSAFVFEPVNHSLSPTSVLELPNAQDYFHQLAGLATTPDRFPNGCIDSPFGRRSVQIAPTLPIGSVGSKALNASLDPNSEVLQVTAQDVTTHAQTLTALTTQRVFSFSVADVNGDGLNDIVASGVGYSGSSSGNLVVFLNNGDGTFRMAFNAAAPQSTFVLDDVNGDGKVDVVMSAGFDSTGNVLPGVVSMLGNGDGTFRTAVASATSIPRVAGPFVTGDFNGDGKLDLLVDSAVLLGNGDGTFSVGPALPATVVNELGVYAAAADLDHDGKLDVVYTGFSGSLQVLLGNGDGSFRLGARYASITPAQPVTISEIDGDGNLDIVVGNASQGIFGTSSNDAIALRLQILLGRGDGTFVGAPAYAGGYTTNLSAPQTALADFNADGKLDALVEDPSISGALLMLPGDGHGAFGTGISSTTHIVGSMLVSADLNGDGKPDAVVAGYTSAGANPVVATLINQGGGSFAAEHDYLLPSMPVSLVVGDFNGDGRMDVAVGVAPLSSGPSGVYVLFGQADGTLGAPVRIDASTRPASLVAADLNGDGRADLIVADQGGNGVAGALHVYLGNADGSFTTVVAPTTSASSYTFVAVGDMNKDGKLDLVAAGSVSGSSFGTITPNLYTFAGKGDGTFQAATIEPLVGTDGSANAVVVADFNHDGIPDVAVGTQNDFIEVLLGKGDGTYGHALLVLAEHPSTLVAGDLNNDSYPELLAGVAGAGTIVFVNPGTVASWSGPTSVTTPPATPDFAVSATPATGSVTAGQSLQSIVSVTPSNGFAQSVTFQCAGLPTGASCAFSPASISPNGAAASTSLTISTAPRLASLAPAGPGRNDDLPRSSDPVDGAALLAAAALAIVGSTVARRRVCWTRGFALMLSAGALASCGGGTSGVSDVSTQATPTTYAITVTATSGSTSHDTAISLTVR